MRIFTIHLLLFFLPLATLAQTIPSNDQDNRDAVILQYEVLKQSNANWTERTNLLRTHIGRAIRPRDANLIETSFWKFGGDRKAAESLEKTQTWWMEKGIAYMAFRNVTSKHLESLIIEVSQGLCDDKGSSFYFTMKPVDGLPIAQSEFVVFSFLLPERLRSGRRCLDIFSVNDLAPNSSPHGGEATVVSQSDATKHSRERLAADLAEARKKQKELEERLLATQASVNQENKPVINFISERRVALLIGNATYKINPLKNPVNDSNDMARSLRSVGFDVIEVNNATLLQMREATRRFADKLSDSDVGLVYYSGHGVEVRGKNYLIPVNADIKREYEVVDQAYDASQFLEMMDSIRGPNNKRVNILIVDACRNNDLERSWRSTTNGLARMDAPGGTFISFATAPGRVAADGVGRNSPYTKHLLQALKQPNMPIEQVFKVVRRNVMGETKGEQIPWENSSLVGDFYFTVQK